MRAASRWAPSWSRRITVADRVPQCNCTCHLRNRRVGVKWSISDLGRAGWHMAHAGWSGVVRFAPRDARALEGLAHRLGIAAEPFPDAGQRPAMLVELHSLIEIVGRDALPAERDSELS